MEKILTSLNIIAISMTTNQIPKNDGAKPINDWLNANEIQEVSRSEVTKHKIDNSEAVDVSLRVLEKWKFA